MPLPATTYDAATLLNPGSALTDFSLMVDLSRLSAAWWAAVDSTDGRRGRASKDDGTELAVDWIDFNSVSQTGWARVKWSGSLATSGSQAVRLYPPQAANDVALRSSTYGAYNAYDSGWVGYWPLHDLQNRVGTTGHLAGTIGHTPSTVPGKLGDAKLFDDSGTQYLDNTTDGPFITGFPLTLMAWSNSDDLSIQTTILCVGGASAENRYARLRYNLGDTVPQMNIGSSVEDVAGAATESVWQHHAARITATQLEGYLNGVGSGSPAAHSESWSTISDLVIGARRANGISAHYMSGIIDDAQLHAVERSDAWIAHEYAQTNDQASFWGTWTNTPVVTDPALVAEYDGDPVADGAQIDLGDLVRSDDPQALEITITNEGGSEATSIVVSTTGALDDAETGTLGATLAVDASGTIVATLDISTAGAASGSLSVASDDPESPLDIDVVANIVAPELDVSMDETALDDGHTLALGSFALDSVQQLTLTLENTGDSPLNLGTIAASGDITIAAGFNPSGTSIAPGATSTLRVNLDTASLGSISGTVSIPSNDVASPFDLALSGSVVAPELGVTYGGSGSSDGDTIDLGDSIEVDAALTVTLTLANTGTAPLTLGTISADGDGTISPGSNPSGSTLIPGANAALAITFDTSSLGDIGSSISIPSDDAASPFDLDFEGTVVEPTPPVVVETNNMLRTGASFLAQQRHANMTEPITYRRGGQSVQLSATVGRPQSQDQQVSGFVIDTDRVDFIVREADLVIGGSRVIPSDGDEIEFNAGSGPEVFTVRRDELDQTYRKVDEFGGDLRVHTVRRGAAS